MAELILAILAIAISAFALAVSFHAFRRSARYQDFEFSPRLQIENEHSHFGHPSSPTAFRYQAELVNSGLKPIDIVTLIIDYGSEDDADKKVHHMLTGAFSLSPGEKHAFSFDFTWRIVNEVRAKLKTSDCRFFLRVRYREVSGNIAEGQRPLGGFRGDSVVVVHQPSYRLS